MFHKPSDEIISFSAQSSLVPGICKYIDAVPAEGHVGMHSRTMNPILRFRHKRSMKSVPLCYRLYYHLKGHNIICSRQSLIILKIYLMLRRRHLMMRGLYDKSHLFQSKHYIPARILSKIHRPQVKICRAFMGYGSGKSVLIRVEKEEFALRSHIEFISHSLRFRHHFLQNVSGIALKNSAVRLIYIADQPRHFTLLGPPRKYLKSVRIRIQIHIRIFRSCEAFNRRTVKHDPVIQRFLKLIGRNRNILQRPEYICKLQADKPDVLLFRHPHDILLCIIIHSIFLPRHDI